jgi:NarL family two-component system response regulator LiaR
MAGPPIRVLIADDHPLVREGLRIVLQSQPDMLLVAEATNGVEAVAQALALRPDVIVMDLKMPAKDGLAATSEIIRAWPEARIIILTSFAEDEQVPLVMAVGAVGFLLKDTDTMQVVQVIRAVHYGASVLPPAMTRQLLGGGLAEHKPGPTPETLTPRELDVLRLVAEGLANREIAERLHLAPYTVGTHIRNILGKLQLDNRTQAAIYAREHHLI